MPRIFKSILFVLITLQMGFVQAQTPELPLIDIVLDIDWSLLNPTNEAMARAVPEGIVRLKGKPFRASKHLGFVMTRLHQLPRARIWIFTGKTKEDAAEAVQKIYEEVYKYKPHSFKPHRVLSFEDMFHDPAADPAARFSIRNKKDLSRFFDLKNVVIWEDIQHFVMPGQERNVLWLGKTYNDRPHFELAHLEDPLDSQYTAPDFVEWQRDQDKLLLALEKTLEAYKKVEKTGCSFVDALNGVLLTPPFCVKLIQ